MAVSVATLTTSQITKGPGMIQLGVQNNSVLARVGWLHVAINKLFERYCRRAYSTIKDVELVLRISDAREFGREGLQRARLMKGKGYFSIDLVVHGRSWVARTPEENRDCMLQLIDEALSVFASKCEKAHFTVEKVRLREDFQRVQVEMKQIDLPANHRLPAAKNQTIYPDEPGGKRRLPRAAQNCVRRMLDG